MNRLNKLIIITSLMKLMRIYMMTWTIWYNRHNKSWKTLILFLKSYKLPDKKCELLHLLRMSNLICQVLDTIDPVLQILLEVNFTGRTPPNPPRRWEMKYKKLQVVTMKR